MKKIFLIIGLLIIYIFIIHHKLATAFIEKIDLNLLDDELAIIFLSSDNYKSVLLKDNSMNSLLIFDIDNSKNLNKNLNKFIDTKLDYLFVTEDFQIDFDIDYSIKDSLNNNTNINDYIINTNDNIIIISNNNYNLCIYDIGSNDNIDGCNFIYFLNMNYQINLNENLKAIFYEKYIENKFKENTYIKWIDNYDMTDDVYHILKLSPTSYDIITIPNQN